MGIFILGACVVGVATVANSQEESPVLWGILATVFCVLGGLFGGWLSQCIGGVAAFGLMQLKIARYG